MNEPGIEGGEDERTEETELLRAEDAPRSQKLRLVVAGEGVYATHPLPDKGDVTIGRSEKADVCIDDPLISRKHAVLHIGDKLAIEDLGSSNGMRVRDQKLESRRTIEIFPGDSIDLGTTTIIVQRGAATRRPRRVLSHGAFEARVEDECARAERSRAPFAALRFHVEGRADRAVVQELLSRELRAVDVIAMYGPDEYEVLLVDTSPDRAVDVSQRLVARLLAEGMRARVGVGCYPRDGMAPEEIIARACEAVKGGPGVKSGEPILVRDGAMQRIERLVKRIAVGTISVLILGETGVGKEVMAETIHNESPRKGKPLLRLNCAALPEALLSSELFGHERGAFTGAVASKPGLFESADGGTVFLDEVGELPISLQVKLLRVLEERKVLRVGSVKPRSIDVRFLSATNRDVEAEVAMGTFRQDLFFRLNGISIMIPPLRERVDEIERLVAAFVTQACRQANQPEPAITADAMALLERYRWPGNIRELRNVVERAVLLCSDGTITREHLPVEKMEATLLSRAASRSGHPGATQRAGNLPAPPFVPRPGPSQDGGWSSAPDTVRPGLAGDEAPRGKPSDAERARILDALDRCAGNQTKAAKLLAISRRTLVARLEMYGLPRPRKPAE